MVLEEWVVLATLLAETVALPAGTVALLAALLGSGKR